MHSQEHLAGVQKEACCVILPGKHHTGARLFLPAGTKRWSVAETKGRAVAAFECELYQALLTRFNLVFRVFL